MAPKKTSKQDWREDGDSAHWVAAKRKGKKITTPSDAKSSAKYTGKGKTKRKITTKK
jgi:hypothetical protein